MHLPQSRRRWLVTSGALLATPLLAADFWRLAGAPGAVVLLRHAQTEPGTGDPPGFRLGACHTQRNLSESGRQQALRIGQAFASAGLRPGEVRSSAWCRCIDTAELAFGTHRPWEAINSFFNDPATQAAQTRAVHAAARAWQGPGPLVLVTHQVNVTALTGEYLAMGELLVTRAAGERLQVLARLVV